MQMLYWRVVQHWVQHRSANQRKLTQVDRKWTLDMREIYGLLRLAWTCKGKVRTDGPQSIEGLWRDKMTADRSGLSVFNSNFIIGQLWNSLAFKVELLVKYPCTSHPSVQWIFESQYLIILQLLSTYSYRIFYNPVSWFFLWVECKMNSRDL